MLKEIGNSIKKPVNRAIKKIAHLLLPLYVRKHLAIWLNRQTYLGKNRCSWWALELISDFAKKDINEYHKFMWVNHLRVASTYEVEQRFGETNMKESRRMFFSELDSLLLRIGIKSSCTVKSVFEVGCSLGYQLRYLETDLFTGATLFEGIDVDEYSVSAGTDYLQDINSKVQIKYADMKALESVMDNRIFDVIICSGVLMYLNEDTATSVVNIMLKHSGILLAITGLADPQTDNSRLRSSVTRDSDNTFIHNIDSMVEKGGGNVLARRWEGSKLIDGHTIYFVFASNKKKDLD